MTKEEILKQLIPIISKSLSREESLIVPQARLGDDLGADSLDTVQMVTDIENHFGHRYTDKEIEKVVTVQDAVELVHKYIFNA